MGAWTPAAGQWGPDCAAFLSWQQRLLESVVVLTLALLEILRALRHILRQTEEDGRWPWLPARAGDPAARGRQREPEQESALSSLVPDLRGGGGLVSATKTVIYLLNPCHLVTMMHVSLLTSPPLPGSLRQQSHLCAQDTWPRRAPHPCGAVGP